MPKDDFIKGVRAGGEYIGKSEDSMIKYLKSPDCDLPYVNHGAYKMFLKSDLDTWLERHTVRKKAAGHQ